MADPFLAEIRIFPFNFPPTAWATCNGQLIPISQNTALFALLGTTYGGDGKSTFALPDLQRRAPMHPNQYPPNNNGLSGHDLGELGGSETVTLLLSEIPVHTHVPQVSAAGDGTTNQATGNAYAKAMFDDGQGNTGPVNYFSANVNNPLVQLAPTSLAPSGGSQPHNNMQPYLVLNFCIALQGVFPPRP
jgi:microcystin-dependent protein